LDVIDGKTKQYFVEAVVEWQESGLVEEVRQNIVQKYQSNQQPQVLMQCHQSMTITMMKINKGQCLHRQLATLSKD
jgi:hypothetical protein